jgi:hypothetical protein
MNLFETYIKINQKSLNKDKNYLISEKAKGRESLDTVPSLKLRTSTFILKCNFVLLSFAKVS